MPAEVRCPTCGRETRAAPYCTHCGGVIPEGSARPRGLDRHDLEERIRLRRTGESPFRRGSADQESALSMGGAPAFVPEPSDALARRESEAADLAVGHVDHLANEPAAEPADAWGPGAATPPEAAPASPPPADPPPLRGVSRAGAAAAVPPEPYDDTIYGGYGGGPADAAVYDAPQREPPPPRAAQARREIDPYEPYDAGSGRGGGPGYDGAYDGGYDDEPPRRTGPIMILGFVVLGIAALLAGGILFSLLNSSPGTAAQSSSPSSGATVTQQATASETPAGSPSGSASAAPSATGSASSETPSPGGVPADFSAQTQPCATSEMGFQGCAQDGSTISGTQVWIWVGFKKAQSSDVLGVEIVTQAGESAGDGSVELTKVGCDPAKPCSGYIQMTFNRLSPGGYDIKVTLNGTDVASGSFSVS